MQYKSKDKAYMLNLKTAVYRLERSDGSEQLGSWEYIRKYIVLNDLLSFVGEDKANPNHVDYHYNPNLVDVEYMFVTNTEHPKEVAILEALLKKAGIKGYYRTSYSKSKSAKIIVTDALTACLNSEIKLINPKKIVIFGPGLGKLIYGEDCKIHEVVDNHIVTSSIIQVLKSDVKAGNKIKHVMWGDFNKIVIT